MHRTQQANRFGRLAGTGNIGNQHVEGTLRPKARDVIEIDSLMSFVAKPAQQQLAHELVCLEYGESITSLRGSLHWREARAMYRAIPDI